MYAKSPCITLRSPRQLVTCIFFFLWFARIILKSFPVRATTGSTRGDARRNMSHEERARSTHRSHNRLTTCAMYKCDVSINNNKNTTTTYNWTLKLLLRNYELKWPQLGLWLGYLIVYTLHICSFLMLYETRDNIAIRAITHGDF